MNYDPYAPPRAAPPPPSPPGRSGGDQPWEIGEVIPAAWDAYTKNPVPLSAALVITVLIFGVPVVGAMAIFLGPQMGKVANTGALSRQMQVGMLAASPAMILFYAFLEGGLTRLWLTAARGGEPALGTMFSGADRFVKLATLRFLLQLPSLAGMGLALVGLPPAVGGALSSLGSLAGTLIVVLEALGLFFAPFYVVDQNLGPIAALETSWKNGAGQRGKIFLAAIVASALAGGSIMCCGIGALVGYPTVYIAAAIVYLRTSGAAPYDPSALNPPT
jgi:uncharacterized membrane protein